MFNICWCKYFYRSTVQAISKYSEKVYAYKPYVPRGGAMYQMKFIHKTPIKKGTYLRLIRLSTSYPWEIVRGKTHLAILRKDARWVKNVR